ncbi:MAG: hypothetical protein JXQ97_11435 [Natronospirillum sp.]
MNSSFRGLHNTNVGDRWWFYGVGVNPSMEPRPQRPAADSPSEPPPAADLVRKES